MSTKKLSRTVIEGGRHRYSKRERRRSHRIARHAARQLCAQVACEPASAELVHFERRPSVRRMFYDKLGPAERWLRAQVGRHWRDVEGEILSRFDVRSLPGRHIVYDHLLPSLFRESLAGWRVHRRGTFFVDPLGILRFAQLVRRRRTPLRSSRALDFAGDRLVAIRGARTYWLEPTMPPDPWACIPYRQAHELTREERREYDALDPRARAAISRVLG